LAGLYLLGLPSTVSSSRIDALLIVDNKVSLTITSQKQRRILQ
jgi:hypothetical protein